MVVNSIIIQVSAMKKLAPLSIVFFCLLLISRQANAQDDNEPTPITTPVWVSDKGYWVVESNKHVPNKYTVRFYTNTHLQVYHEKLEGVTLRFERRKTKMLLKRALETSISNWEKQQVARDNEGLIMKMLQKKV